MIYELLLFVVSSMALATLGIVLYTIVVCQLTYVRFKKDSRGIPMAPDRRLLGNHVFTWPMRKNFCENLLRITNEMMQNGTKTIGFCYSTRYAAFTTDLDLVKLFIYDEPNRHMNRTQLDLPLKEYENSILLAKDDQWRKIRRHFAPALKPNRFKTPNVMHEIENSINKFITMIDDKLDKQRELLNEPKHKFELDDIIHRFTLNVVFSCFYKQTELINFDDKPCDWTETVDELFHSVQNSSVVHASVIIPILRPIIDWLGYNFTKQGIVRRQILGFVKSQTKLGLDARREYQELIANKAKDETIDPDNFLLKDGRKFKRNMVNYIIDAFLDGKLTQDEYVNSSCFLFGAADKTVADCLVNTLYHVGYNPDIQERLRESIKKDGAESEYLGWVIHESLRLTPPAPVGCSRTITREIEIENGHVLPKGTFVVTCAYVIHRLKEYWGEDAEEFRPERWANASNFHPMQFLSFGAGPRGCLGREFALHEIRLVMSALLTRYNLECNHKPDLNEFDSPFLIFLIPNSPTYLTIKRL